MSDLNTAIMIATNLHKGQFRTKDEEGLPYIVHPLRVMVDPSLKDDIDRQAAVLHDVIEDTDATLLTLRTLGFCDEVINTVDALSRREGESYKDYIRRLAVNPRARRIKPIDIKDNTKYSGLNDRYLWAMMYLMSEEQNESKN